MWAKVKKKLSTLSCHKNMNEGQNNILNFHIGDLSNEFLNLTSLKELSDLIKSVYERRATYLADTLPNIPECPRCALYQTWMTDVYLQSDYFISIIEEFDSVREDNLRYENEHLNGCEKGAGENYVEHCAQEMPLKHTEPHSNRLKEKYTLLKQKYNFVKSKQQVMSEDKELAIQTLDSELEKLIREQMDDKEMLQKLNLELLNVKKANKDKDVEIARLRGEFYKIATEYGQFKMETQADLNTLLRSSGKLDLDKCSGNQRRKEDGKQRVSKSLASGSSSLTLETHYINKSYRRSSTQIVFECERKSRPRCLKPLKKL